MLQSAPKIHESVTVRFAGDSGDGMQLTGDRFAHEAAHFGNLLLTLPDYPAEIRAPAGTVAGVSSFQITFGCGDILSPGDRTDVLVAMNPAALKANLADLMQNGVLICDSDSFNDRGLEKADYVENPLADRELHTRYTLVQAPITTLTATALEECGLDAPAVRRCRNFFALGMVCRLFNRDPEDTKRWIERKFASKPKLITANKLALAAGMSFAESSEIFPAPYEVPPATLPCGRYRSITGHQGAVLGLLAAAQRSGRPLFFSGYPITPASEILHELSCFADRGVTLLQAEDEIAACCAAIGASFAGSLAATATSGPGMSLKQEALGLAVIAELPLVVINVQRAGPSTGMPTKTEQSDLAQAMYGRHGESPAVILAIDRPARAFEVVFEACRIALERMTPVIVLSDGYVANGSEPWRIPNAADLPLICPPVVTAPGEKQFMPYDRDPRTLARPWALPGSAGLEHRIGGLEKQENTGAVSYDGPNHERMVHVRAEKVRRAAELFSPLKINGDSKGDLLAISWGGTYGPIAAAVRELREQGKKVSQAHLRHLNPLHPDLGGLIKGFKNVLVAELNQGQLRTIIRAEYLVDARGFSRVQGRPFKVAELIECMEEILSE